MGKKKKETIEEGGGSFMMMFVTLSLILLAFFILLNSLAVLDAKKKRMALGSLLGSFGIMPGADSVERSVAKNSRASADLLSGEGVQKMFDAIRKEMEMILSMEDLDADSGAALFDEKTGEVKIILAERLLFPEGEAVVSLTLFPLLYKTAEIARKTGGHVVVTGHTDSKQTKGRGGSANNWRLSLHRGTVVARHLEAVGPLTKGQILASGLSHYRPLKTNDTPEGRAANRRVEINIRTKDVNWHE